MPNIFINGYCREWQKWSSVGVIIENCFGISDEKKRVFQNLKPPVWERGNLFRGRDWSIRPQSAHQTDIHLNILTNFDDISRNFDAMCVIHPCSCCRSASPSPNILKDVGACELAPAFISISLFLTAFRWQPPAFWHFWEKSSFLAGAGAGLGNLCTRFMATWLVNKKNVAAPPGYQGFIFRTYGGKLREAFHLRRVL